MPRKKAPKVPPPPEGAAFAVPLENGLYSACRVLLGPDYKRADAPASRPRDEADEHLLNDALQSGMVLVATSAWIGKEIPTADDPAVRAILRHRYNGKLDLQWIDNPLPKSFIPIGTIKPTAKERNLLCNTFCMWETIAVGALDQWRWDHDREALLAEQAANAAESARKAEIANRERAAALKRLTLDDLASHTFFARWPGEVAAAQLRQSRQIMKRTVQSLQALGRRASEKQKLQILQECIEKFNLADERSHFIDTIERDDICEEFYLLCCACGLGDREDLADEWREW